jgi:hypothetical protein
MRMLRICALASRPNASARRRDVEIAAVITVAALRAALTILQRAPFFGREAGDAYATAGADIFNWQRHQGLTMNAPARHVHAQTLAYSPFDSDEDYGPGELFSGERICPPLAGDGNAMLRAYVFIAIALGGGWALLSHQATWQKWISSATSEVSSLMDHTAAAPAATPPLNAQPAPIPAATAPLASAPLPPNSKEIADTPNADESSASVSETTTGALPSAGDDASPSPLPSPTVDPADPYQTRASAAGLNPGLSHALLARLSPTDYRNAGIAIRTAMAKTPDTGVFVWPRQRRPEQALFQVHFVRGAAPDCRRYVVTVAKDGWSTTALPMEKCGVSAPGGHRSG